MRKFYQRLVQFAVALLVAIAGLLSIAQAEELREYEEGGAVLFIGSVGLLTLVCQIATERRGKDP